MIEPIYRKIGKRLREHRVSFAWTQDKMAARLKISRASVVNIEQGRQRVMLHTLERAARLMKVPLKVLFEP